MNSIIRYGTEYGGFWLPNELDLNESSVIYCIGVGEDISFDVQIGNKSNSNIYLFDPTPRSNEHVNYIKELLDDKKELINSNRYGGGYINYLTDIIKNRINSDKIIMNNYGVYTKDDIMKFYKPLNNEYVSHSLIKEMVSNDYIYVEIKDILNIMKSYNHTHIDLLKLDVEGVELFILNRLFDNNIYPKYLCVDFDLARNYIESRNDFNIIINRMTSIGYKIIKNVNYDISFILEKNNI